jgi:hypothetical protein
MKISLLMRRDVSPKVSKAPVKKMTIEKVYSDDNNNPAYVNL